MVNCNTDYPFPVLKPEPVDYKLSTFDAVISVTPDKDRYVFHTNIDIKNNDVNALVEDGTAQLGINIQCESTWLRKIQPVQVGEDKFSLSTAEVHNRVYFCPVITADKKLDDFRSSDFTEEYDGLKIVIHPGDPLAIGEAKYFDADYADDILKKGDPIISVATEPGQKDMTFSFENQSIMVYVPEKTKNAYLNMQVTKEKYSVLSMLVYLPAVTESIRLLDEDEDTYISYAWAKTIKQSVFQIAGGDQEEYERLLKSPFQTAQKLTGGMDKAILDLESWSVTVV